jgi:hypothetical protein
MKKILFLLFSLNIFSCGVFSQDKQLVIPDLIRRTFALTLEENDFHSRENIFLTLDTSIEKNSIDDFEYKVFNTKKDFLNEFILLNSFLKNKEIIGFSELEDNFLFNEKRHWILRMSHENKIYTIRWWFSEVEENKLKGITISFIKKGNV